MMRFGCKSFAGIIVLFFSVLGLWSCQSGSSQKKLPNIILLSIDTLRADRLGAYGYKRPTTPNIDAFAKESSVFLNAVTAAPWTLPSHLSMLTGLYPSVHGVSRSRGQRLAKDIPLLAEVLKKQGYKNFAYTAGGYLSAAYGFDRGFDEYFPKKHRKLSGDKGFNSTISRTQARIEEFHGKEPFFIFMHTYDVHCPYTPPEPYFSQFKSEGAEFITPNRCGNPSYNNMNLTPANGLFLSDRYDGAVRWVDDLFGNFFRFLKEKNILEDTVVIITSDHGEEFFEHGRIGHQSSLYRELLMVPLIVKVPGASAREIKSHVNVVDIYPTILALAGVEMERKMDGISLLDFVKGDRADIPFRSFEFSENDRVVTLRSSIAADSHFIWNLETGKGSLFDFMSDPLEKLDQAEKKVAEAKAAEVRLAEFLKNMSKHDVEEASDDEPEHLEHLKALGYL